jgi:hypothetical protein
MDNNRPSAGRIGFFATPMRLGNMRNPLERAILLQAGKLVQARWLGSKLQACLNKIPSEF